MKRLFAVLNLSVLFLVFSGNVFAQSVDAVTLSTAKAGENAIYTVTFTPSATNFVPNNGKIVVTFDAGFTLNSVTIASSSTMDGGFSISVAGDSVTFTRDGTGTPSAAGAQVDISFANVGNNQIAGSYNLKVTIKQNDDTPIETIGTKSFTITPADLDHFAFGAISPQTAGTNFQITITAQDAYNNTITTANYSLTLIDDTGTLTTIAAGSWLNGVISPTVNITKATASDKITATANGISSTSGSFAVNPAGVSSFEFATIASPQTAGSAFSVTITAKDAYDNVATGFSGSVNLTVNKGDISPASSGIFSSGTKTVSVTINTANTDIQITADDGSGHTGTSNTFNVNPGPVASFAISAISSQAAGEPFTITVTAKDAQGNTATSFAGTVDISDGTNTISPATSGSFSNGLWSGSVTITGTQTGNTITVTNSAGAETGTSNAFDVTASDVAYFTVSTISSPQTAGTAFSITITAKDANGNTAASFTGTASLSDSTGTISPKLTRAFTNGTLTDTVTITQSFTNNQIVVSAVGKSGSSNAFDVNPGALDHFTLDAINSPQTAGTAFDITITAKDAFENTITSYSGTPTISNTTGTISPTTAGAFSNGVRTESVTITKAASSDQITVTDGAVTGSSNTFTVQAGALDHIVIEDAPGGTGAPVGALSKTTDQNVSLFAIGYDANNNYVEDVSVSWSVSGGIGTVSPATGTNTVFNPTTVGSGTVSADDGSGHTDDTGTITVTAGALASLQIRDSAGGAGSVVGNYLMTTDQSLTVYAAGYDADGNYISDQSVTWSSTGLTPSLSGTATSSTFSPTATGSGTITATSGSLSAHTGAITVSAGALAAIKIRDEAGGGGSEVGAVSMTTDDSRTFYAAGYDAEGNYKEDISVTWASTGNLSPAVSSTGTSVTFSPDSANRSGTITADAGSGITDATGTISVSVGALKYVKIVAGATGNGAEYTTGTFSPGDQQTFHAAGYDADGNYIADESVAWSLTGSIGSLSDATGTSTVFTATTVGQGSITADHATALDDATGTLTVVEGNLDHIVIRDAPGGAGNVVGNVNLTADQSITLYAAGYDAADNYLGDYSATWSLASGNLAPVPSGSASSFTFNPTTAPASGVIQASYNAITDVTGTISVSVGALAKVQIRTAANGGGVEVTTHTMTTDETFTVWAAGYDADDNFIADTTVSWTSTGLTPALSSSGRSVTLDPTAPGTATVTATEPNSGLTDNTGAIVINPGAITHLLVRSEAGGGGMEVGDMTLTLDDKLTLYAAGYDAENNYSRDVVATWSVSTGNLDAPSPATGTSTVFAPSTPETSGKIRADSTGLIGDETGTLTVGNVSYVKIRDAANGAGSEVGDRTLTADESLTLYAAGYDAGGNYVGDVSVTWSSTGSLAPAISGVTGTSVTFSPTTAPASGTILADHATATDDVTGTITVTPGVPVGTISLSASPTAIPADGSSTSTITSGVIKDADGNPVAQGTLITVSTSLGTIITADASASYTGTQVAANASGQISFTLQAPASGGTAYISAASVGGSATGSTTVQITNLRIVSISSDFSSVSQGQTNIPVRMVVENLGSAALQNATANLTFTDVASNDRTGEYSGISQTGISVAAGETKTLTFSVSVGGSASLGSIIIDGNISGTVDGNSVGTSGAGTPYSWVVQTPAALEVLSVQTTPDSVSQGQQGISVVLTARNTGQAAASIDSIKLSFKIGATTVTSEYIQSQASGNPVQIAGGATEQFEMKVDVSASATTGTVNLDGAIYGKDANSSAAVVDVGAASTDSWVVTQAAAFQITALIPSQYKVTSGQTRSWTVKMAVENNSSSAIDLDLDPAKTYLKFVIGSDVTSQYSITYPTALLGGGIRLNAGAKDTLKFVVNITGTTTGIAAINGVVTGTDVISGKAITDNTNDTGSGSVTVQTPASVNVTSVVPSQDSVSSGQTATWNVTVTVENTGQSAATLSLDSTLLSFRKGTGYVFLKPSQFQGGGLVLNGNSSGTLIFSITKTTTFSGTDSIDATVGFFENNSGRYVVANTAAGNYGTVIVQTPAAFSILSVHPSQPTVTQHQTNTWTATVVVKNTGQSRAVIDFQQASTFLSFSKNGTPLSDYAVQQPSALEGSGGSILYGGKTDSLTFVIATTGADTGSITIHATLAGTEANSGRSVSTNTFGGNSGLVEVQAPPVLSYIAASLSPKSVNRGSNASFEVRVRNSGGATLVLSPSETKFSFSDGVHSFEAFLNENVVTEVQPGDTTLVFVSTLVPELLATGNYTPDITLSGTQNGNAFQANLTTGTNELAVLEKAVLDIVSITPSQTQVTSGQTRQWYIWMNVANNGGSSVRLDSTQVHLFIGTEVTDEYSITVPTGFWQQDGTENPVLQGNETGTLRFVVTHTGSTTGPATIQGRLWVTDQVSHDQLFVQTDGGAGTVRVQSPAELKINYTIVSQAAVTIGQTEDWFVTLNLSNKGESSLRIDTTRAKTYLTFTINGQPVQDFVVKQPTELSNGSLILQGGESARLVFTIDSTTSRTGYCVIHAHVTGVEVNSDSLIVDENYDSGWNGVNVQSESSVQIVSTENLAFNAPNVNTGQTFNIRVRVRNNGGEAIKNVKVALASTGRSIFTSPRTITRINAGLSYSLNFSIRASSDFDSTEIFTSRLLEAYSANTGDTITVAPAADSTDTTTFAKIQKPAALVIREVYPSQDRVLASQTDEWQVFVVVQDTGQANILLNDFKNTDIVFQINGQNQGDYLIEAPDSLRGGGQELVGGQTDTLVYRIKATGHLGGTATILATLNGRDVNSLHTLSASNSTSILVQTSAAIQIINTTISSPHVVDNGNAEVNLKQQFTVNVFVENKGNERVDSVKVRLRTKGHSQLLDSLRTIPTIPARSIRFAQFDVIADSAENLLGEEFDSRLISGKAFVSHLPAVLSEALDSVAVARIEKPAQLEVVGSLNDQDGILSANQTFEVRADVVNKGRSGTIGSGTIAVELPENYRLLRNGDTLSVSGDTTTFSVGTRVTWKVLTPQATQGPDTLFLKLLTAPKDENTLKAAAVIQAQDTLIVNTIGTSQIASSGAVVNPPGARDGVVSTEEEFTVVTHISATPNLTQLKGELTIPQGYVYLSPKIKSVQGDSIVWTIRSPEIQDQETKYLRITARGTDESGTLVESSVDSISIRAVKRANLSLDVYITEPQGAKDGVLTVGQPFIVRALVTNSGQAGVYGTGKVKIIFGATGVSTNEPLEKEFTPGIPVDWRVQAPDTVTTEALIRVQISAVPYDENSNRLSFVSVDSRNLRVETVQSAKLTNTLSISSPEGAKDGIISTSQEFLVEAVVQSENCSRITSELILPADFYTENRVKNANPGYFVVSWLVRAPSEPKSPVPIKVISRAYDANDDTLRIISQPDSVEVTTVSRANVAVNVSITDPPEAANGIVSTQEEFTVTGVLQNLGLANFETEGSLKIILPKGFVLKSDTIQETQLYRVSWRVQAPEQPTRSPQNIRIELVQAPKDENTNKSSFVSASFDEIALTVETKKFTILKWGDFNQPSVVKGQKNIAVLGLILKNLGLPGSNDVWLSGLRIQIQNRKGNLISPKGNFERIWIAPAMYPDQVLAESLNPQNNPVEFSFSSPLVVRAVKNDSIAVFVDLSPNSKLTDFLIAFDGVKDVTAIDGVSKRPVLITDAAGNPLETLKVQSDFTVVLNSNFEKTFGNYPNPFGEIGKETTRFVYYFDRATDGQIQIFTLTGDLVWTKAIEANKQTGAKGLHDGDIVWDGTNLSGLKVVNGVYIAVLTTKSGKKAFTKIAVVK
ncbi:MAG: hypothetical protein GXO76_14165 [Calditrichaeota bacterium]|nr:hypothetical protein [Calditrichota bacterium]